VRDRAPEIERPEIERRRSSARAPRDRAPEIERQSAQRSSAGDRAPERRRSSAGDRAPRAPEIERPERQRSSAGDRAPRAPEIERQRSSARAPRDRAPEIERQRSSARAPGDRAPEIERRRSSAGALISADMRAYTLPQNASKLARVATYGIKIDFASGSAKTTLRGLERKLEANQAIGARAIGRYRQARPQWVMLLVSRFTHCRHLVSETHIKRKWIFETYTPRGIRERRSAGDRAPERRRSSAGDRAPRAPRAPEIERQSAGDRAPERPEIERRRSSAQSADDINAPR